MRSKSSWASRLLPQTTADLDDSENPNPRSPTFPTTAIVLISRALLLIIVASYFYTLISWNLSASPVSLPSIARSAINGIDLDLVKIDWSRFAYAQYVTTPAYLCNSVMIFESLHRLGARADKLMMYPHQWDVSPENDNFESRMLRKARDEYGVGLAPIEVLRSEDPESTWAECFTKLLVFNQTQYDRLIHLDSDATVRQVRRLSISALMRCTLS